MKATIEARIYFEPDQPGRLYMKPAYPHVISYVGGDWCPPEVKGDARVALHIALKAVIGAKARTAAGLKEMVYKMELNSAYSLSLAPNDHSWDLIPRR